MKIVDFYESENREALIEKIQQADWVAGKYLARLLREGSFRQLVGGGTVYLLLDGEHLVSFVTLSHQDCVDDKSLYPWVGFVYTFPQYRGHRYVGRLLAHAEETARAHGCETLYVATDHIGLYETYGYSYWESRIDIYKEESRIYRKQLGGKV